MHRAPPVPPPRTQPHPSAAWPGLTQHPVCGDALKFLPPALKLTCRHGMEGQTALHSWVRRGKRECWALVWCFPCVFSRLMAFSSDRGGNRLQEAKCHPKSQSHWWERAGSSWDSLNSWAWILPTGPITRRPPSTSPGHLSSLPPSDHQSAMPRPHRPKQDTGRHASI